MRDTIPALEQFIEPTPIRFTPDAPGWYVVGGVLLVVLLCVAFFIYRHYRKNLYRRVALRWLEQEEKRFSNNREYVRMVYAADMLAKRISIQVYGRENTASLQGAEWIDHLNKTSPLVSFSTADERVIRTVYESEPQVNEQEASEFLSKIKRWIKKHRV